MSLGLLIGLKQRGSRNGSIAYLISIQFSEQPILIYPEVDRVIIVLNNRFRHSCVQLDRSILIVH